MTRQLYALCADDPARHFSPHVWKTVMSLAHKGLDFETVAVPFTQIPTLEGGATKTVPLLRDGERLVADSFAIAEYLEETYPQGPSLFRGEGGRALARFVEGWSLTMIHSAITPVVILDIHRRLPPADQAYFRASREARFGKPLEAVGADADKNIETVTARLEPLRHMLRVQPFLGGTGPLFADYILFGALQWARIATSRRVLADGDPVSDWFERCLDLHGGVGRSVTAA